MKKIFSLLTLAVLFYAGTATAQQAELTVPNMPALPGEIQELVNDELGEFITIGPDTESFPFLVIQAQWASYSKKAIIVFFVLPAENMGSENDFTEDVNERSLIALSVLKPDKDNKVQSKIWYNKPLLEFVIKKMKELKQEAQKIRT